MIRPILIAVFLAALFVNFEHVAAQDTRTDSTVVDSTSETIVKEKKVKSEGHSPRKALIYSAVLPGLGQAYNRKYWKIPIIYGLGGFTLYQVRQSHVDYVLFKDAYQRTQDSIPLDDLLPELEARRKTQENLFKNFRDQARTNRDMFIVYTGVVYMLNLVDAVVDAHLKEFDLTDDLTLEVQPTILRTQNRFRRGQAGLLLTLHF